MNSLKNKENRADEARRQKRQTVPVEFSLYELEELLKTHLARWKANDNSTLDRYKFDEYLELFNRLSKAYTQHPYHEWHAGVIAALNAGTLK